MTPAGCAVACGITAYLLAAVGFAVLAGKGIRIADEHEPDDLCALIAPESWSTDAVNAEFDQMLPGFVTAEVFELDNAINRKARGAA
jgi:hypothetical protein